MIYNQISPAIDPMIYVLIRDCDYERRGQAVDVVGQHPSIDRLRRIASFSSDQLTSLSLDRVILVSIETCALTQDDDDQHPSFPATIYSR